MDPPQVTVVSLDDSQLIEMIETAEKRLFFAGPGMSVPVAEALARRWGQRGAESVQVILDVDPEVCRLGYGELRAIQILQSTASNIGACIHHRPGIRVSLLLCDHSAVAFSPTPLLIEGESTQLPRPNAIRFDLISPTATPMVDAFAREAHDLIQEADPVESARVDNVAKDLGANPPLKFDLARKVTVFNSQLEFVEFKLKGISLSKRTIRIPPDLMVPTIAQELQEALHGIFKLLGENSEISGKKIEERKKKIADIYLTPVKGFGSVVLRSNKEAFLNQVKDLEHEIEVFQHEVRARLGQEMDVNRSKLVAALTPAVCQNPPIRWLRILGPDPAKDAIGRQLEAEISKAFGKPGDFIDEMKLQLLFKGVTYELLNDPKFREIASTEFPALKLHVEFMAAPGNENQTDMIQDKN